MVYFERIAQSLSLMFNWIAAGSIVSMMVLTCADVILRVFSTAITGTYEVVSFLGAVTISFALAKTTLDQGHISVQLVMSKLSPPMKTAVAFFTQILTICLFAMVSWQSAKYATDLWRSGEVSQTIGLPFFPIVYGIAFTSAAVCLVVLVDILRLVAKQR